MWILTHFCPIQSTYVGIIFLINFIFLNSCTSETTEYCENLIVFHSIYSIFYASISSEYFSKTEEFCNSPKTKNHTTLTVHHIKIFYQDFFCVCVWLFLSLNFSTTLTVIFKLLQYYRISLQFYTSIKVKTNCHERYI